MPFNAGYGMLIHTKSRRTKNNKLDALLQYVDDYAVMLKPSVERNSELWENTRSFDTKVKELKTWLRNRADYIDSEVSKL